MFFFFFNDTATTEIYTLSLHDALPIYRKALRVMQMAAKFSRPIMTFVDTHVMIDRKSTRLNSSHTVISYAVFCLKKKNPAVRTMYQPHREQQTDCTRVNRVPS